MTNIKDLIKESGLDEEKQLSLSSKFAEFESVANEWKEKSLTIEVTDENQKDLMASAKEGRKFLTSKRTEIERLRKSLKDASLQEGRMIDKIAKQLTELIEPTEKYLKEQETFAERKEAERKALLIASRIDLLSPYLEQGVNVNDFNLGEMDNFTFNAILETTKNMFLKKKADLEEQERQRLAKIEEERIRIENQRLENLRLQKQLEEQRQEAKRIQEQKDKELAEAKRIQDAKDRELAEAKRLQEYNNKLLEEAKRLQEQKDKELAQAIRIKEQQQKELLQAQSSIITRSELDARSNSVENTIVLGSNVKANKPNTIYIGDLIQVDKDYFYYKDEKIEDINKVYDLLTEFLKTNMK
jgi:mannose/fructose/N-acetylgalactosamine-specific phosphotransferase system component IIB